MTGFLHFSQSKLHPWNFAIWSWRGSQGSSLYYQLELTQVPLSFKHISSVSDSKKTFQNWGMFAKGTASKTMVKTFTHQFQLTEILNISYTSGSTHFCLHLQGRNRLWDWSKKSNLNVMSLSVFFALQSLAICWNYFFFIPKAHFDKSKLF